MVPFNNIPYKRMHLTSKVNLTKRFSEKYKCMRLITRLYGICIVDVNICYIVISSINTISSISTPVRYYSNTNNIKMNRTACYFVTPDIIAKYRVTMAVSLIVFKL